MLPCRHALPGSRSHAHVVIFAENGLICSALIAPLFRLCSDTTLGLLFDSDYLDDPKHCPHPGLSSSPSSPLLGDAPGDQPFLPPGFLTAVLGLAAIGITVTLLGALAFILLLQHSPMATVVATLVAQVMVPTAVGVLAMRGGEPPSHQGGFMASVQPWLAI